MKDEKILIAFAMILLKWSGSVVYRNIEGHWYIDLTTTHLEKKDADDCTNNIKCVYLGVQIKQLIEKSM